MIHIVLVAVGAAAGSMVFIVAWQRRWNSRQILVANVVICALAGAVAGALVYVAQENMASSFLSYGLLGTAAPFASSLLPPSPPRNAPDAWQLIRRSAAILAVNILFCATAASATYMLIAGSIIYAHVRP
jgi:hypothetical protein